MGITVVMKATRPTEVRRWLAEQGIRPSSVLGQNFLVDGNIARLIVDASGVRAGDRVLEIGPGCGALTEELLARGARVRAVEKDRRLWELLRARLGDHPPLELVLGDALQADLGPSDILVSNLPYSAGTRILMRIFEMADPPSCIVVTLQREVAARLAAPPGSRSRGLLSVIAQRRFVIEALRTIPASCFHPAPDVTSTLLRLTRRDLPLGEPVEPVAFREFLKAVFGGRRKQLWNALHRAGAIPVGSATDGRTWLRATGVDPVARPEALDVAAWTRLFNALHGGKPKGGEWPACR